MHRRNVKRLELFHESQERGAVPEMILVVTS